MERGLNYDVCHISHRMDRFVIEKSYSQELPDKKPTYIIRVRCPHQYSRISTLSFLQKQRIR